MDKNNVSSSPSLRATTGANGDITAKASNGIVVRKPAKTLDIPRSIASKNPFYLLVQGKILYAKNQVEEALQIAIRLKEGATQEKQIVTLIEAGLLEAICHFSLGKEDFALTVLHDALEHGVSYGYYRTFIEEDSIWPLLNKYWRLRQHNKGDTFKSVPLAYVNKLLLNDSTEDENLLNLK